jgi:Xaa-Pro aminopeptidase
MPSLERRRKAVAAAWGLEDAVVLVGAGEPIPIPGGGDQTYPFRAHPEYYYLALGQRPGSVLAYDPLEGWTDFVPEITESERVWEGVPDVEGTPRTELEAWLAARQALPVAVLGSPVEGVASDEELTRRLRELLTHARRPKGAWELDRMRHAAQATQAGFEAIPKWIRPGVTERAIQIELETAFLRAGAQRVAYDTIVAGGPNSAVLHFTPTGRALRDGELLLIDAGAEMDGYACDVTRTYPVGDRFSAEQRALYAVVLEAEQAALDRCGAGTEWSDIHLQACADLTAGLVDFGLLRGNAESLVERAAYMLFFPHGIGHMVGLGVRDASGTLPGRTPSDDPRLKTLRADLPLQPGYVMTVEPGIYFIRALLEDPERRETHAEDVDWARVDQMLDFGGIRLEDDVLVTDGRPEVLTSAIERPFF